MTIYAHNYFLTYDKCYNDRNRLNEVQMEANTHMLKIIREVWIMFIELSEQVVPSKN